MYISLWETSRGHPDNVSFMQFSTKIDVFEQKDSQGFENSYNSYEQYPLEKFFIFTIYQNYTLALTNGRKILQRCWRNWSSIFPSIFIRLLPWTMSAFIFMFRFTDVIMYPSFHYQSQSLSFYTGLTPCFNHIVLSSKSIILFPFGEQPQTLSHQHARFISMWQMFSGGG